MPVSKKPRKSKSRYHRENKVNPAGTKLRNSEGKLAMPNPGGIVSEWFRQMQKDKFVPAVREH